MRIGVDLMGGDQSPQGICEAVLQCCQSNVSPCTYVLFAQQDAYPTLAQEVASRPIEIVEVEETIEMGDSPLYAVRKKKNSSMAMGIRYLLEGKIDAFLSTGNTGALIALSMLHLPLLPTIQKPALLATLPTEQGEVIVLDVGAHISFKPEHLMDYARLGLLYTHFFHGKKSPKVGLLNIGAEEEKGTREMQEAYGALQDFFQKNGGQFVGNVEGREVFQGEVDVLVTDGFTGNVFLKTCEGASAFLIDYLKKYFSSAEHPLMQGLLNHFQKRFNYGAHPGALLCGVEGVVVKCHGNAPIASLVSGLQGTAALLEKGIITKMRGALARTRH